MPEPLIVNDVTQLNPVPVAAILRPSTVEEVQDAVRRTTGPISIGGGHFSMGGQTASPGSLHLDMRRLNQVVSFSPLERTLRVQAGIRWCDIQRFIDPHGFSLKIMQTYANFTVGGSLSVNVHGRYMGLGPLILSVRSITVVLADGERVAASPAENAELFHGAVGGYGGLGIIVEAELELADNSRVERVAVKLHASRYLEHFRQTVRHNPKAVFHNADLYPPRYTRARAVTWVETHKPVTVPHRLQPVRTTHSVERYFLWAISETPLGKWRREFLVDPLVYLSTKVHWRNFEAGYDVAELEPASRAHSTYVLQEYFVPVQRFDAFVAKMAEILERHRVNMINVSVRHALPDPGSLLAWAREEVFAFVMYYKQRNRANARQRVAVWTRELIDAVLSEGGTYYLPYQPHGTPEQFHRAYPGAKEFFTLKSRLDPEFRFRNVLWDKYYAPTLVGNDSRKDAMTPADSNFHAVYDDTRWADDFYRFLQNIFHLYPEDRFHTLIQEACAENATDEAIYRQVQAKLPAIKPFLADLFYALPALMKQKKEMARQTLELLGGARRFDGYVEIGSTGRYYSHLRKHLQIRGPLYLVNDVAPGNSPADILERGGFSNPFRFISLVDYRPLAVEDIPDESVDLVTCYIGLHHAGPEVLEGFLRSIVRILRRGGYLIYRDHDVTTPAMNAFVTLAHTVFNAGLGVPWEANARDLCYLKPVAAWARQMESAGLEDKGARLLQAHDPSANTLMGFVKV
jgi:FAD/FMN-containing dehydrogenase/SAM-dependent methyltransferase